MTEYNETDVAVDMDALFQTGLDDQKAVEAEKDLLPPSDTYVSTPPLAVTAVRYEAKDDRPERVVFTAYGIFTGRKTGKQIRQGIKFSPQLTKVSYDGGEEKLDRASQNYLLLRRAYQKVFGSFPATVADIKSYVENYPIGVRGGQYEGREGPAFGIFNIFAVTQ